MVIADGRQDGWSEWPRKMTTVSTAVRVSRALLDVMPLQQWRCSHVLTAGVSQFPSGNVCHLQVK